MNTYDEERAVLNLALALLKNIYGEFEIDPWQRDKPDAAIILQRGATSATKAPKKIGIEITTVDVPNSLQYLNDEKFARKAQAEQLRTILEGGESATQPNKKIAIAFPNTYISDGVTKKASKYEDYRASGKFEELVVLAFSSHFDLNNPRMRKYHAGWCSHNLTKIRFPFDKVIFLSTSKPGEAYIVYDKFHPVVDAPARDVDMEAGDLIIRTPVLKMGESFNLSDYFDCEPILKPKEKK